MPRPTFLIGDVVWDGKQVDVSKGYPHILGLAAGKTPGEVGVAEHASRLRAVERFGRRVGIGLLALRGELLLAEETLGRAAIVSPDAPVTRRS